MFKWMKELFGFNDPFELEDPCDDSSDDSSPDMAKIMKVKNDDLDSAVKEAVESELSSQGKTWKDVSMSELKALIRAKYESMVTDIEPHLTSLESIILATKDAWHDELMKERDSSYIMFRNSIPDSTAE